MRIDIISAVPDLLESPLNHSIIRRAREKGLVEIHIVNLHDYGKGNYKQIDDYGFGGDAGMVIKPEPLYRAITDLTSQRDYDHVIYTSPDGETLDQSMCNSLSTCDNIIILCGHYKGIDHRIREHLITKEISIGSYVLSGGELAACVICDSIIRLIPGALTDETSALSDSFPKCSCPATPGSSASGRKSRPWSAPASSVPTSSPMPTRPTDSSSLIHPHYRRHHYFSRSLPSSFLSVKNGNVAIVRSNTRREAVSSR